MFVSKKNSWLFFVIRLNIKHCLKICENFIETVNEQHTTDNSFVCKYLFTYLYRVMCLKICNERMRIYMYF